MLGITMPTPLNIGCDSLLENLRHYHGGRLVVVFPHFLYWQGYSARVAAHILSWQLWIGSGLAFRSLPSGFDLFHHFGITR
jgi:hypothetical protein